MSYTPEEWEALVGDPIPDLAVLRKVLTQIDEHPESFDQENWSNVFGEVDTTVSPLAEVNICQTSFCVAGHAVVFAEGVEWQPGRFYQAVAPTSGEGWRLAGMRALGLTNKESNDLFLYTNTRKDIQKAARRIAARAGEIL